MSSAKRSWNQILADDERETAEHVAFHNDDDEIDTWERHPAPATRMIVSDTPSETSMELTTSIPQNKSKSVRQARSIVTPHFTKSVNKNNVPITKCNYCSAVYTKPEGTTNLRKHLEREHPSKLKSQTTPPVPSYFLPESKEGKNLSKGESDRITADLRDWIVCTAKPMSVVDEPKFIRFCGGLNSLYKVTLIFFYYRRVCSNKMTDN